MLRRFCTAAGRHAKWSFSNDLEWIQRNIHELHARVHKQINGHTNTHHRSTLSSCLSNNTDMLLVWWLIGRFDAYRPKGRGFESLSSRHVESLGKSFTRNCLRSFGMKLRHSIRVYSGAPLSSCVVDKRNT